METHVTFKLTLWLLLIPRIESYVTHFLTWMNTWEYINTTVFQITDRGVFHTSAQRVIRNAPHIVRQVTCFVLTCGSPACCSSNWSVTRHFLQTGGHITTDICSVPSTFHLTVAKRLRAVSAPVYFIMLMNWYEYEAGIPNLDLLLSQIHCERNRKSCDTNRGIGSLVWCCPTWHVSRQENWREAGNDITASTDSVPLISMSIRLSHAVDHPWNICR
jgi:hypothetical protein